MYLWVLPLASIQAPIVKTSEEILKDTPNFSGRALPETNPLINKKGAYQPIALKGYEYSRVLLTRETRKEGIFQ